MPKSAAYKINWSPETEVYECSETGGQVGSVRCSDHRQLQVWLDKISSFAFSGQAGAYTARKEHTQQENCYWYAYRRDGKRVQKKYLGKSEAITIERLEYVASLFRAEREEAFETASLSSQYELMRQDDPILAAKLRVPSPPLHALPRARLFDLLQGALARPLTLVSASAGSGKSTLLSSWLAQHKAMRAGWSTLERDDDEPGRMWKLVFTAFERLCPGSAEGPLALLRTRRLPNNERMLITLLNHLEASQQEMVLVLDDYHFVNNVMIAQGIAFLLEHLPGNVHVIISTRVDPPLPLPRLRASGHLLEVRNADLRFTAGETRIFLDRWSMGKLSQEESNLLFARTEGWIAGLQLITILLQRRASSAGVLAALSKGRRFIADYLVQEVLEQLPEAIQHFLLSTSILERLQGKLCETITGQPDGQATLGWLEQANLFLHPLALCLQFDNAEALLNGLYGLIRIRLLLGDEAGARKLLQENERVLRSLGKESNDLTRALTLWRTQVALALDETAEAQHWVQEMALKIDLTSHLNPILEEYYLLQARLLLRSTRWQEAESLLQWLCVAAEGQKRQGSLIRIYVLQSLLYQAQGEPERALVMLACALRYSKIEGYHRVFIDEGAPMFALLTKLQQARWNTKVPVHCEVAVPYLNQLVSSLSKELATRDGTPIGELLSIEPLSRRESEVLRLVSEGKSNREIAQQLVIEVSSVKSHFHTIYGKLQVQSRTQAIVRARSLDLL